MSTHHPYASHEDSRIWEVLERALDELVKNQDVMLCTPKEYIIGYLVKSLR